MRIITYNVHGCVGMDGRLAPERIANVIERFDPDVVALQELDRQRKRSGHLDQTRIIAELLEMNSHFHPALQIEEEEYGDAILSKYPMRVVRAGALPSVPRQFINETRGALWVAITIDGREVQFINTHLGLGRTERRRQAQALLGPEWVGAAMERGPVVVCGDFNSPAGWVVHGMLSRDLQDAQDAAGSESGHRNTFATTFPFVCLDHIFLSDEFEVLDCEVPRTALIRMASDHFPLVADVMLKSVPHREAGAASPEIALSSSLDQ